MHVTLVIYNVLGERVATLEDDLHAAGDYEVKFDASGLSTGVYFHMLSAGDFSQTQKMVLLK